MSVQMYIVNTTQQYYNSEIGSLSHINLTERELTYIHTYDVTCYEKIDHLKFFIKTEFSAWYGLIAIPMCAESSGASFMKKY